MPVKKQDAHRALELLEQYRKRLDGPENEQLHEALSKAIVTIRSRLFQALLDIQEFYTHTLEDHAKSADVKTEETLKLVERWEKHPPPIPVEATDLSEKALQQSDAAGSRTEGGLAAVYPSDSEEWIEDTIELERSDTAGLGVSVAGGSDNPHMDGNPGIFVTKLLSNTPAEADGRLQLGDQILSVNGKKLLNSTHGEAVQALKDSGKNVVLVVCRKRGRVWTPISEADTLDRILRVHQHSPKDDSPSRFVDVVLNKNERGLGFSIAGGTDNQHVLGDDGIFITKIIPGGAAEEEDTLTVGDRILQVNGHSMVNISHEEAVSILKATDTEVTLQLEKNAIRHVGQFNSGDEEEPQDGMMRRTVELYRPEGTGLGFNIIGGEGNTGIFISFIAPDSVAGKCGELRIGDQIIEVNGRDIQEVTHEDAAGALKGAGATVTLVVEHRVKEYNAFQQTLQKLQEAPGVEAATSPEPQVAPVKQLYVRALCDYDSSKDDDRPSQGLSFKHGDILHILNGSDDEWWQAALVGNQADDGAQGLIPSKRRVERRYRANQKSVKFTRTESTQEKDRKLSVNEKRGARASFKLSRKLPFIKKVDMPPVAGDSEESKEVEEEHIPTYEPVTLKPRGYARPVIILGPLKEDINDRLVQEFPDKFAGCVPHTTRAPRDGEADGRDYYFVSSVAQMERDIQAHLFIEAGRYKDNLYGTSIKAVQEVANQGKHCILGVSGYAIRRLQMADLHPIAICIRPTSTDVLLATENQSEEQCRAILEKGTRIEQEFAEFFTAIVEGDSLPEVYNRVKNVIHEQSGNYIWVPSNEGL